ETVRRTIFGADSSYIKKSIALKVRCSYSYHNGCQQLIDYESLETHERTCQFENQPCTYCKTSISKKNGDQHTMKQCLQKVKQHWGNGGYNEPDIIQSIKRKSKFFRFLVYDVILINANPNPPKIINVLNQEPVHIKKTGVINGLYQ
ncbi:unnamed protein product, partial [Didymodactylos carnosus]